MRTAIITGAGTGIGKYSALGLAKEGYAVVLAGRRAEKLNAVLQAITESQGQGIAVPTDVSRPDNVKALFQTAVNTYGQVDLLFNNAGTFGDSALLEDLSFENWMNVLNANLTGAFLCTQEAFKVMKAQDPMGGRIINNGSVSAQVPRVNSAPYTAVKHGITGLTKSTALDGRKYNIACGQIDIGNANTTSNDKFNKGVMQAHGAVASEPMICVDHVVRTVVHMANLPLDTNILSVTVMASHMPLIGRG